MKKNIQTKNQNEILDKVLKTTKKLYLTSIEQSEKTRAENSLEANLNSLKKLDND